MSVSRVLLLFGVVMLSAFGAKAERVCIDDNETACQTATDGTEYCPNGVQACELTGLFPPKYTCPGRPETACFQNGLATQCSYSSCQDPRPACNDGIDNDNDGIIDSNDPGCDSPTDDDESHVPQCSDGIDNDDNGLTDYPEDPSCHSAGGQIELTPECADGKDNDLDGSIDMGDPGCNDPDDGEEYNEPIPQCQDTRDNDGDGFADFPEDPGCESLTDELEEDPEPLAECSDGDDNDGDALIDNEHDRGCGSWADDTEDTPTCTGGECVCSDDADGDGVINPETEFTQCEYQSPHWMCPLEKMQCEFKEYIVRHPQTRQVETGWGYGCPAGEEFPCAYDNAHGRMMCSPKLCVDPEAPEVEEHDTGEEFPEDDGPRDENGMCIGELRIMSGTSMRCRKSGTQTAGQNCCKNEFPPLEDTMGAPGEPKQREYREEAASYELWNNQCDQEDQEAALLADSDYCIYLGTYCAEKWTFIGCVQRSKSYCCFNSRIAKMIHEQGRPQLNDDSFGSAKNPNCRGFTPEEFQALDFSKMDLTGYSDSIRTQSHDVIQQEAHDEVYSDMD